MTAKANDFEIGGPKMKAFRILCCAVVLLVCLPLSARQLDVTITNSGDTKALELQGNTGTFEELISRSPSTVSIVLTGCMRAGTCDTLETNTSTTSSQIRKPTIPSIYDYFTVTASWTGGTNVSVKVNGTVVLAGKAGSGSG